MSLGTHTGLQAARPTPRCRLRTLWLQSQCSYLSISQSINCSLCAGHQSGHHRKAREGCHPGHALKSSPTCRHSTVTGWEWKARDGGTQDVFTGHLGNLCPKKLLLARGMISPAETTPRDLIRLVLGWVSARQLPLPFCDGHHPYAPATSGILAVAIYFPIAPTSANPLGLVVS